MLDFTISDWLENGLECDKNGMPSCVRFHAPGIYSIKIFNDLTHLKWMEEILNMKRFFKDNNIPSEPPNPFNHFGIVIDNFDFKHFWQALIDKVISPIA